MPGFQNHVAEDVEDVFSAFCQMLAALLTNLATVRRRSIGAALYDSIISLREVLPAFQTKLAGFSPNRAESSSANM